MKKPPVRFEDRLLEVHFRTSMDTCNEINSFEEIGMTDPDTTQAALIPAIARVERLNFDQQVNPKRIHTGTKPP